MIETFTCKNGLRIVLEPVSTVRSVSIGIWIQTGSRHETKNNNGISHFLEHMLFKGTKHRTARQIAEAFDSIGGQVNAFTSKEYTCLFARVLDTYKEHALDVLSDMLFNSTFLDTEIEREKNVIMEEINMYEDTPDDYVHDLLAEASFGEHSLGMPIIGSEKQIQSFSKQSLTNYMKTFYAPDNIVVSISGNVETSFFQQIESFFDRFNQSETEVQQEKPIFQAQQLIKHKEIEQAHVCFGYPGLAVNDPYIPSLLIVNSVLGGGMSSRLFQEVREERGLAYSVFSYHATYTDSGLLTIYAGTNKEQVQLLQTTISETVSELTENGLKDKEIENSKEQLKGNIMLSLENTHSRMSRNGRNELLLKKQRTMDDIIREIDSVNQQTINKVLEQTLCNTPSQAIVLPE